MRFRLPGRAGPPSPTLEQPGASGQHPGRRPWVILGHAEHDPASEVILGYRLTVAQHDPCAMRPGAEGNYCIDTQAFGCLRGVVMLGHAQLGSHTL